MSMPISSYSLPPSPPSYPDAFPEDLPTQVLEVEECSSPSSSSIEDPDEYETPERRLPPVSDRDSAIWDKNLRLVSVHGESEFVSAQQLLKIHPMKFIAPDQGKKIVAITLEGKHVVLQQSTRSCVPSAISMLALDLKRIPLFEEMRYTSVTNGEREFRLIEKAGLKCTAHQLSGDSMEKMVKLYNLLNKGPGLLNVSHPEVGSHIVVLDEISFPESVTFRDPYHGWMVDVRLEAFKPWIGDRFLSIEPVW